MRIPTLFTFCVPLCVVAQLPLPYSTGFDNSAQQSGWQQFRTGHLSNYSWTYTSFGSPSAPNHLWHDYPVEGSATDTVQDWWVSPALDLSAGGTFTCKVNIYAITGSAMPSDACGIFLLTGSADPELATVTPLLDLLPLVTSSSTYTPLPEMTIAPTGVPARIAFYYQATQNWLTPGIDDISVAAPEVGFAESPALGAGARVYPNPGIGPMTVEMTDARHMGTSLRWQLFDARGALVQDRTVRHSCTLEPPAEAGAYRYVIRDAQGADVARGTLEVAR